MTDRLLVSSHACCLQQHEFTTTLYVHRVSIYTEYVLMLLTNKSTIHPALQQQFFKKLVNEQKISQQYYVSTAWRDQVAACLEPRTLVEFLNSTAPLC
jgi:hypothetical protein